MSSPSVVYDDEYPDSPRNIPEVVLVEPKSDIYGNKFETESSAYGTYGNKIYYFKVDCCLHRLHADGSCERPVYNENEISRWKRCPIPELLAAFLLKRFVAPVV
jgi:hypothetical protein